MKIILIPDTPKSIKDFWGLLRHDLGFTDAISFSDSNHSLLTCIDKKH